jgi:hypothetical protein
MNNNTTSPDEQQPPEVPEYKILTKKPLEMSRPMFLINGRGYIATKVAVEKRVTNDAVSKTGSADTKSSFKIVIQDSSLVIREDGKIFGTKIPLSELDFKLSVKEYPNKKWSGEGVNKYVNGERPDAVDIFTKLQAIIGHFINFRNSLADQHTMEEFIACWILSTWFLDAFNVIGYLWINGERGSGKSNLLLLVADLSYLGQYISHSGSFASLRDMADLGATLAFDDAENITYQEKIDPDKKALLLAGNRRGVTVPLKEPGPNKSWTIRYVNAFCPRAFSAIRIPDSTLLSRSIIVPLVRTASDDMRAKIDPLGYAEWPVDHDRLHDDLWAIAISNLSKIKNWDTWIGKPGNAWLTGRDLQPWRSVLVTAKLLETSGVQGLYQRMDDLSVAYQKERSDLEGFDFTRLVLATLIECAIRAIKAISAVLNQRQFNTTVSDLTGIAKEVCQVQEMDIDPNYINNRTIGRILGRLRFKHTPRPGGKGSRQWLINLKELAYLATSYNVSVPEQLLKFMQPDTPENNGTDGTNGSDGPEALLSNSSMPKLNLSTKPEKPCYSCGSMDYWQRSDGGWVCNTCHPNQ